MVNVNNQIDVLVEDKWISNSKSGTSYLIKFSYTYNNQLNSRVVACKKKEWEMAIINQHYSAYYGLNRDGSRISKIVPIINSMYWAEFYSEVQQSIIFMKRINLQAIFVFGKYLPKTK